MADLGCIWLFGRRSKSVGTGLAYRLYARSVCEAKALLQLWYVACCAIYTGKCYMSLPLHPKNKETVNENINCTDHSYLHFWQMLTTIYAVVICQH